MIALINQPNLILRMEMEDQEHILMALDIKERGAVGCAYYKDETLFCMDDIKIGGLSMIETLKLEIQPTIVLVSPRIDQNNNRLAIPQARAGSLVDDGMIPTADIVSNSNKFR